MHALSLSQGQVINSSLIVAGNESVQMWRLRQMLVALLRACGVTGV